MAGLIHMLADAQEGFKSFRTSDYPWYAVVCCAGFLLILSLEKVLIRRDHSLKTASALPWGRKRELHRSREERISA